MTQYGLGRRYAPDPRDQGHLLAARLVSVVPTHRAWTLGPVVDQADTGECVGFGWYNRLTSSPVRVKPSRISPVDIYKGACLNDEWPENDTFDPQAGSSVRGGAKFLQAQGWIGEYAWASDVDTVARYVLGSAPVVLGINWYSGMDSPDHQGVIRATGSLRGGHCILMYGANSKTAMASLVNSWGPSWARKGRCQISFEDLERLLKEDGEACDAVEIKHT